MVRKTIDKKLNEAADDGPKKEWAKYGSKVDDFINDTIEKAKKLHDEGEELLVDKEEVPQPDDVRFLYVSGRTGFLKGLIGTLAQRYEGFKREG